MIAVRVATAADEAPVNRVLTAAYGSMAQYDPALLSVVLPAMGQIDPAVLTGGTYYVAEADGIVTGAGGWTFQRPGGRGEPADPKVAHLRYIGIQPDAGRRGVGRALVDRCVMDARAAGVEAMHAYSTRGAEAFYAALGFAAVAPHSRMIAGHALPGTLMVRPIGGPQSPSAATAASSTSAP